MIRKFIQDLKEEFSGYSPSAFSKDLMAGLTTCAVALPLALAFGVSSGATASAGLITAIIAGCLTCALGGAFYQISGPTGAMAAILMSLVASYGLQGVFAATFMAGILLILAGIFKVGRLASFIPGPVIAGFTSGIALIIALGQLDNFFGVTSVGSTTIGKIVSYFTVGFSPNLTSILVGLCVIVFMFVYPKKWNAVMPSSLVSIILATAVCMIFDIDVPSVGVIPKTIISDTRFNLGDMNLSTMTALISPAFSIAVLGMIESLLCGASAGRMAGKPLDNDRELVAQGISNTVLPFFGGIPSTAAIARTSVAIKSGAKTRLAGIFHAVFLLISMLVLSPVMSRIPLSSLAGVLIVTAWRMNEWETIRYIFKRRFKSAMLLFTVTMVATVFFDLTVAIMIGIVLALIVLLSHMVHVSVEKAEDESEGVSAHIAGEVIFANAGEIETLDKLCPEDKTLRLSLEGVPQIDISGVQAFDKLCDRLEKQDRRLELIRVRKDVRLMLEKGGVWDRLSSD